jgi:hypothetical protein
MDTQIQEGHRERGFAPRVVAGLCLLTLGVLFLLDRTGTIDFWEYGRYWPVFLIALGLAKLFQPEGRGFGLALTVFGSWLLLDTLGILRFEWDYAWPVGIILVGLSLIWRGARGGLGWRGPHAGGDAANRINAFAMLGGVDRKFTSQEFRGGEATAILGGCELDFRQATPAKEGAVVDTFALWGGIEIKVPEDWTVVVQGTPIFGGFSDDRKAVQANPAKQLVVKGVALMGGVEVKT